MSRLIPMIALLAALVPAASCIGESAEGIAPSRRAEVAVKMDFLHRPLPEIPLPNDIATRYDPESATGRRINASLVAPTGFERRTRRLIDELDGWGLFAPITVPFDGALGVRSIIEAHHQRIPDPSDDVVYVIDVSPSGPSCGRAAELDLGQGNYPVVLEQLDGYWEHDVRGDTISLTFEEHDEDVNGNGALDPGEDTDLDGLLDRPNYLPDVGAHHTDLTLAERADATMSFYERETSTLLMRLIKPLRERTTYAVVITRRLEDARGNPVGSPYPFVNHASHTKDLGPLAGILEGCPDEYGALGLSDIAFTWTFTTGTVQSDMIAARDGLYGLGVQAHLATEHPADLARLHEVSSGELRPYENRFALGSERFQDLITLLAEFGVVSMGDGAQRDRFVDSLRYADLHTIGTFSSPQLFPVKDAAGDYLDWNDMKWPVDLDRVPAEARAEDVTFWLSIPRKESSARGEGKPAPLVVLGHGYGSNKGEMLIFHAFFSRFGLAVLSMDNVTHGIDMGDEEQSILEEVSRNIGIQGFARGLVTNRSRDQDLDGIGDSGADFWSAYAFHTRDVVRQTALDYMQLIRIIRSWDGEKTWAPDVNGNGEADDIAGDIDGDGVVDLGGPDGLITMTGGSLGGIMSTVMGALEPHITAILPIAGGGGLGDIAMRSIQGGVRESVQLRLMGPLYVGEPDPGSDRVIIRTVVPDLNGTKRFDVAFLPGAAAAELSGPEGGTVLAQNHANGEHDCAVVRPEPNCIAGCAEDATCARVCLTFRLGLASDVLEEPDAAQHHTLTFYRGNAFVLGLRDPEKNKACTLLPDATERVVHVAGAFENDVAHHYNSRPLTYSSGAPLAPLADGLGLHRARPPIRRFMGFASMVLEGADPAVYAPDLLSGRMEYGTGEVVETHAVMLTTIGDMNVPANGGATMARAAGFLDMTTPEPAWGGRTANQVLLDTYVIEAVDTLKRFTDPAGRGVLFDPENLSHSQSQPLPEPGTLVSYDTPFPLGEDGFHAPRLDPPLHSRTIGADGMGGYSGAIFPFVIPTGKHGFEVPGHDTDRLHGECVTRAEAEGTDPAECDTKRYFDGSTQLIGMIGRYLASGGEEFILEDCQFDFSCPGTPPPPEPRGP
jgi:hypothetical protein